VVGLSSETELAVRRLGLPPINYTIAIDSYHRTSKAAGVTSIPHALLIDPNGIVRFEGNPANLDEKKLEALVVQYGG